MRASSSSITCLLSLLRTFRATSSNSCVRSSVAWPSLSTTSVCWSSKGTAASAKEWSVGETMEWLGQQGRARYATTFAENHIDGELLLQLTNDDLRDELQILSFGDRRKLELLIQQLKGRQ